MSNDEHHIGKDGICESCGANHNDPKERRVVAALASIVAAVLTKSICAVKTKDTQTGDEHYAVCVQMDDGMIRQLAIIIPEEDEFRYVPDGYTQGERSDGTPIH